MLIILVVPCNKIHWLQITHLHAGELLRSGETAAIEETIEHIYSAVRKPVAI